MSEQLGAQVGSQDKNVPWYDKSEPQVSEGTRELLEQYSKIPANQIIPHLQKIRDEAWEIFAYPCVGQWRFIELSIGKHPHYQEVLSRMKTGEQKYLDLGCCFGQDIRRLVYDGVPSETCYGSDLRLDFMQLGYNLFLDKETLKSEFIAGDVFDTNSDIKVLDGQVDVLHAASFFHLFDLDQQKQVARRIVKLLKPQKGSLLLGRHVGNIKGGSLPYRSNASKSMYRHDPETWKKLWDDIGEETGTKWEVEANMGDWAAPAWQTDGARRMDFTVRRA